MTLTSPRIRLPRCPKCRSILDAPNIPPAVTFASGAQLLEELGITRITHQGIRYIAQAKRYAKTWPFGPDRPHRYWTIGGATAMATGPFLDFFLHHYAGTEQTS